MFTNVYEMFTIVYMKKVKSFRLEEDVIETIQRQDNPTQFIENLVRQGEESKSAVEDYIIETLDEIKNILLKAEKDMSAPNPQWAASVLEPAKKVPTRSKPEIISEIKQTEAKRDEELEYCQDSQEAKRTNEQYQSQINDLWQEFHALTNTSV